ncbi:hypothetical protein [Vibrio sp. 99-70-13A1]|uniref:hypothetical protein n=1 Tax=Vibrio sp. 99-70-13A1 TaxID=2607601 RepID=UPI0014933CC0|nr:hypothetical protein [Vibrio sp. 99-70-13A1]NOH99371.1 hypothetical protein [Vibrio sp. 99-70-13A1]
MKLILKVITFIAVFYLGYLSTGLLPKKIKFSNLTAPKTIEDCLFIQSKCSSSLFNIHLLSGSFKPLESTEFKIIGNDTVNELLITSDDNRFGTIKAVKIHNGNYSVLIPYCSNKNMKIILFTPQVDSSIRLNL